MSNQPGLWQRVVEWFTEQPDETKSSSVASAIVSATGEGRPVYTSQDYQALAKATYQRNPIAHRAVDILAQSCAGIRLQLFEGDKALDTHPIVQLLDRPNNEQDRFGFVEALVTYLYLSGNSYIEAITLGGRDGPAELWTLRPDRMKVIPNAQSRVGGYTYEVGSQKRFLPAETTCQLKTFNPLDDWYGLAPLGVAAQLVDQLNAANDWNTGLFQNSAKPPGALIVPAGAILQEDQRARMEAQLQQRWQGTRNARRPMILEGGLDWKAFAFNPADLDWLAGRQQNARDIAVLLGVPPEMLADVHTKTYASYQEARKSFYQETVLPLMDRLLGGIGRFLLPMYGLQAGPYRIGYDPHDIEALQADRNEVSQRVVAEKQAGLLTVNEAREELGKKPIPDGDVREPNLRNLYDVPISGAVGPDAAVTPTASPVVSAPTKNGKQPAPGSNGKAPLAVVR